MRDYPVHVDVTSPRHFTRTQLLLRILIAVVLGWVGITTSWVVGALYLMLPVMAAVVMSTERSANGYFTDFAPGLRRVLVWLLQLSAYMALLTDRFPTEAEDDVRVEMRFTGTPTVGTALVRLITSIPSAFVLALFWCVAPVLWFIGAVMILIGAPMPTWILGFQRGLLRWQARLVAYHASFVDEYPPFTFDTEERPTTAALHATSA